MTRTDSERGIDPKADPEAQSGLRRERPAATRAAGRVRVLVIVMLGVLFVGWFLSGEWGFPMLSIERAFGDVRAPEFPSVDAWLNTDEPLSLEALRGQVVLVDFWTYCCINCMHVLPDLRYLEEKYRDKPFVVIGVHSGKFSEEKDPENIRQAILRHNIRHPVAVDSDYEIWNAYGVRAWPTLVLIDPEGKIVEQLSGEGHRERLDRAIDRLLKEHRKKGTPKPPMRFNLERQGFRTGALELPGQVLADAVAGRLFISDTNHHRVLVTGLDGGIQCAIGCGEVGLEDGAFDKARLHQPQGLALSADGRTLYIADTENHAVRAAHLDRGVVETIAGAGTQSWDRDADGPARSTALSSPWDLARVGDQLYIAMAGTHQIWVLDLVKGRVSVFAGSGREAGIDGPNRRAAFAQPSGLATDGRVLYVADPEVSTIRSVGLEPPFATRTVAGSGGLFDFGKADGTAAHARFQHPLGVALWDDRRLFVADTFNHVIRLIDLSSGDVATFLGTGQPGPGTPDRIGFYEPGGLSVAGDTLYVADTNNHRVVAIDLASKRFRVVQAVQAGF